MNVIGLIVYIFPVLFALTIHEFSHGYIAYLRGDDTAKMAGRLSLNPMRHLDIFGTIIFPLMLILLRSPFVFGWAKPVPINPYNFKDYKKDTALTAAAGPIANFLSAAVFSIIFNILYKILHFPLDNIITCIIFFTIFVNIILGLFNLIPIPPLDGSKVIGGFMSDKMYFTFQKVEKKGMFILLAIILLSNIFGLNIISRIILIPSLFLLHIITGLSSSEIVNILTSIL
ncbi:MAG: site-2 protease family protein [Candidatus Cloacimonadota bacterium]|nr:MAG: site-2 protease family protein [Candidatus Cloacimonadota bacterium]